MQEVTCNKLVIEGKVTYVPATTMDTLRDVYKVMLALYGAQAPEMTAELEKAMTMLRVYAYNTINKIQA
jgi:mannose-6-phosphate isomerase-like protein (cupin superfamily)